MSNNHHIKENRYYSAEWHQIWREEEKMSQIVDYKDIFLHKLEIYVNQFDYLFSIVTKQTVCRIKQGLACWRGDGCLALLLKYIE